MPVGKTNPMGPGTTNLACNMPLKLKADAEKLAKESGVTLSALIRALLEDAVNRKLRVHKSITLVPEKE